MIIQRTLTIILIAVFLSMLFITPAMAANNGLNGREDDTIILIDMLVARPIGLATVITGSALFVIYVPFSYPFGTMHDSWKKLVVKPCGFVFKRPLGEL